MKVSDLLNIGFNEVYLADGEREVKGAYVGDLLSWVMGRGNEDQAWVTIMSNQNVIAVSSLINFSCVILAEEVSLEESILNLAKEKGINILSYQGSSYEACVALHKGGV